MKTAPAATNATSGEPQFMPAAGAASFPSTAWPAEAASVSESLRNISAHLESMSRSMRVVRRLVWGILLSSVLTVLIYGYLAYLGMNMLQQVTNPMGGEYNELFQPMQEYQRALREALQQ